MGVKIFLNRRPKAHAREIFANTSPYDMRSGFWGVVTEVHPETNTCHVLMDTGIEISGVRVASFEWVTVSDGKHLTGERHLPPVGSYVFCLMPNGELSSAFILCSGFMHSEALHADFKEEGEDAANTWKRVENSGWNQTVDYRSGTRVYQNKTDEEATVSLEINQEEAGEERVSLSVHGNTINITKDGISVETDRAISLSVEKDASIEVKGNVSIKTDGDASVEAGGDTSVKGQNITVQASVKTEVKGAQVVLGGTVAPNGKGALCGIPACCFTGAPHIGDTSAGA